MKLYAIDQVSITAVQADTLKPGQSFEVSDAHGRELLENLPNQVSKDPPKAKAEGSPTNKMEQAPKNKGTKTKSGA